MAEDIDTFNHFIVGATTAGKIQVMVMPRGELTKAQALNLAAYLVALADPHQEQFAPVLKAILET